MTNPPLDKDNFAATTHADDEPKERFASAEGGAAQDPLTPLPTGQQGPSDSDAIEPDEDAARRIKNDPRLD